MCCMLMGIIDEEAGSYVHGHTHNEAELHHHEGDHVHGHRGLPEILHIIAHADLTERAKATAEKIFRMTEFCRRYPDRAYVPDPYYEGHEGFELVLDLLEDGCAGDSRISEKRAVRRLMLPLRGVINTTLKKESGR